MRLIYEVQYMHRYEVEAPENWDRMTEREQSDWAMDHIRDEAPNPKELEAISLECIEEGSEGMYVLHGNF